MDKLGSDVERLVSVVYSCLAKYHPQVDGSPYEGTLHEPPAADALSKFLSGQGARLPPSYKAFLAHHNGWSGYVSSFTLMGVDGQHTTAARRDIEETLDIVTDTWGGERGRQVVELAKQRGEKLSDEGPELSSMLPFGTDFNGALLLFDPKTRQSDGEMEVLLYDTSGPSKRYAGFMDMLRTDGEEICREVAGTESEG